MKITVLYMITADPPHNLKIPRLRGVVVSHELVADTETLLLESISDGN